MGRCAVKRCPNESRKLKKTTHGVTFHLFPTDKVRREKWSRAIGKDASWSPSGRTVICSRHFKKASFFSTAKGLTKLQYYAVPSLFLPKNDSLIKDTAKATTSESNESETEQKIMPGKISRLKMIPKRKAIRRLMEQNHRLKEKCKAFKHILLDLKKQSPVEKSNDVDSYLDNKIYSPKILMRCVCCSSK